MTSAALTFDRLAYIDRLKQSGVEENQARAHADALDAALRDTIATKADVIDLGSEHRREIREVESELRREIREVESELRREIREVETRLEAKIETSAANLKVEILRWLIVTQVALAGFIFAVMKFTF